MTNKSKNSVKEIINALIDAKSFDEANTTLEKVKTLSSKEKKGFAETISSIELVQEFHLASMKNKPFHILYIKALNDITSVAKPEFKIIAKDNNLVKKRRL